MLQHTRAELPFSTAVVVDQFDETERERILRLYCTIFVETESQKPIVIGRGGEMIKRIGTEARHDLEAFFETKVFLDLRVKVNPDWRDNERALDEIGVPRTARRPSKRSASGQAPERGGAPRCAASPAPPGRPSPIARWPPGSLADR